MNPTKQEYPFVDLLKPERPMMLAFLASIAMSHPRDMLPRVATAVRYCFENEMHVLLDGERLDAPVGRRLATLSDHDVCRAFLEYAVRKGAEQDGAWLLEAVEASYREGRRALGPVDAAEDDTLAFGVSVLREAAFGMLRNDLTFVVGKPVKFDTDAAAHGVGADYLVVGHTHLRKAFHRADDGVYFNSGTWADLLRVRNEDFQGSAFDDFVRDLENKGQKRLVHREPTVVVLDGNEGCGYLAEAKRRGVECVLDRVSDTLLYPRRRS